MALIRCNAAVSSASALLADNQCLELGSTDCSVVDMVQGTPISLNGGSFTSFVINAKNMNSISATFANEATNKRVYGIQNGTNVPLGTASGTFTVSSYDYIVVQQSGNISSASMGVTWVS